MFNIFANSFRTATRTSPRPWERRINGPVRDDMRLPERPERGDRR